MNADKIDWRAFLHSSGRQEPPVPPGLIQDRTILVTGAGGYIGAALAKAIVALGARRLLLLECSEQSLFEINRALASPDSVHVPILGDAGDGALLDEVFTAFRPEIVFHAAAFKHVTLAERHPIAVMRNNAISTYTLALAAARYRAATMIMISTDKAADPAGILGASKRVAEVALQALDGETRMLSIRMGNVLGSPGSVVPIFLDQISRRRPLTISHPRAMRYFLTRERAVRIILRAVTHGGEASVLAPRLGPQHKIVDLAKFLVRQVAPARGRRLRWDFTGLRPGEKLMERLVSRNEMKRRCRDCGLDSIRGPIASRTKLKRLMDSLRRSIARRDVPGLLRALEVCLPEYAPSADVRRIGRA